MPSSSLSPRYTLIHSDSRQQLSSFAEEVEAGLTGRPKTLPCRFLYDEAGSQLFEEICETPEYYLTRTELEILEQRADTVAAAFKGPITLAELGSGSSTKTRLLIEALLRAHGRLCYVPVDISRTILEASSLELIEEYAGLEVRAIASEYHEGLRHVLGQTDRPKLVVWLGSSIGNLSREESGQFLARVRATLRPVDRLLVGIDLRKEARTLEAAYDDGAGVTALFSLNLLQRMNRELDADFDLDSFRHRAVYLEDEGRVKIDIVSRRAQHVNIAALGLDVEFAAGEGIHTENAFKYSLREIEDLARKADLRVDAQWLDDRARYSLNLLASA
jgi:L-histidine N-alpha-methyltransferase